MHWLWFLLSTTIVTVAGMKLSKFGDAIAETTGLGRLWIGVVMMAAATSLPEAFTAASAGMLDVPDLAAGDLLGAGMSNMLTLGLIDLVHRDKRVWRQATHEHALIAALAITLTGLAGAFILLRPPFHLHGVGGASVLLAAVYIIGMRLVYRQENLQRHAQERHLLIEDHDDTRHQTQALLKRALVGFFIAATVMLCSAPLLTWSANTIAAQSGLGTTFVGASLLAFSTSLPELVTSFAAVRLGAFDLAVGNLFGSNAFNVGAFVVADLFYRSGSLFGGLSDVHAVTALWSIVMMCIGLMGIIYRAEKRFVLIEPDSLLLILVYFVGIWLLAGQTGAF